jgi:beta-galactosidase
VGSVVFVAHDDNLPRPSWLTQQFQPTDLSLTINGHAMKFYQRYAERDESLTLGANSEAGISKPGNMYVVLVKGPLSMSSRL